MLARKPLSRNKKLALVLLPLILAGIPATVYGLTLLGHQTLPKPPFQKATLSFLCTSLVNVTDPNPLRSGFASGNNGTAVYGCGLTGNQVTPGLTVPTSGTVNATLNLPVNVTLYLVPNTGLLGPLSQSQCTSLGFQLLNAKPVSLPVGSYSYCESFQDPASLVDVTTNWFQV